MRSTATMIRSERCCLCGAKISALDWADPRKALAAHKELAHGVKPA